MTAGEMSDGSPVSPQLDARLLADIRAWRARTGTGIRHLTLTIDELDMFLRVAAERDALRRERSVPFTAEIPAEVRERAGEPAMRTRGFCSHCGGSIYYSRPSHAWVHSGAVPENCVPRPRPMHEEGPCRYCGEMICRIGRRPWLHAKAGGGLHPAEPIS